MPLLTHIISFIRRKIWFLAIALISAGLVLMLGAQLEETFFSRPSHLQKQSEFLSSSSSTSTGSDVSSNVKSNVQPSVQSSVQPGVQSNLKVPPQFSTLPLPSPTANLPKSASGASSAVGAQGIEGHGGGEARSFGHFPYVEAAPDRLSSVGYFVRDNYSREEWMDREAVQAFVAMVVAARSQGVQMMAISGFRSIADQQALFARQVQRHGSPAEAAKWSAPAGYSEHHTGYAVDIADVTRLDTDVKVNFEETMAYQWLMVNAQAYGFERSFPRDNPQGVSYEPWHWRYVGTPRANQVFAAARSLAS
ncbi:MAG: M15 family metallopeptidase [Synechococcales bacterium]|nr:M15 family metallopeptidase [Synechococcales bacterium]